MFPSVARGAVAMVRGSGAASNAGWAVVVLIPRSTAVGSGCWPLPEVDGCHRCCSASITDNLQRRVRWRHGRVSILKRDNHALTVFAGSAGRSAYCYTELILVSCGPIEIVRVGIPMPE